MKINRGGGLLAPNQQHPHAQTHTQTSNEYEKNGQPSKPK